MDFWLKKSEFFDAVANENTTVVSHLIRTFTEEWKEATNTHGESALHVARNAQMTSYLISQGAYLESVNENGYTPFLSAVCEGQLEKMNVLIRHGCNATAKDSIGNGALAIASGKGHLDISRQLVGLGFNVNESNQNNYTSLHLACQNGHAQIAVFLVSAGANTEAKTTFGRTPLEEADFSNQRHVIEAVARAVSADSTIDKAHQEDDSSYQKIYNDALKRGSVTVNRVRVIVGGQDGAGKSCLVDALLNRLFKKDKASTERAAVTMAHTRTRGWVATDGENCLDPVIAEGVYRMYQEQLMSERSQEGVSKLSPFFRESEGKTERHYDPSTLEERVETLNEDLETIGMEAKTLTANQQRLVAMFLANRPSEEELRKVNLSVRDIWDLGGKDVYLATHSALMSKSEGFLSSVYMIVMDISKSLSDKAMSFYRSSDGEVIDQRTQLGWIRTNGDFPLYWLGSITAAHEETSLGDHWLGRDEEVADPPVFAIGSHRDVLDRDKARFPDSAVEKWLKKQGKLFEKLLSDSDFAKHIVLPENGASENFREMKHFVDRIFLIDNSASASNSPCNGVKEIRERVDRMTKTYCKGMKQPLFWVYLEILLFRWCQVMKTIVAKVDEIAQVARHPKICNVSSRDEVIVALKYLASVGAILFYPEVDALKDVVFTRPMWVIKAVSAFMTAANPSPFMEPEWNMLKQTGVMSHELLRYRLKQMRQAVSSDLNTALAFAAQEQINFDNRQIVRLLELLDVITPVDAPMTVLYVPAMLKRTSSYLPTHWERLTLPQSDPPYGVLPAPLIVIPTKLKFLPENLFFRLITCFLKLYPHRPRLSRHQCIFLAQDEYSPVEVEFELLYHSRGKWIALTIHFLRRKDPEMMTKSLLPSIKNALREQMKSVCQRGMRGFQYYICCQLTKTVRTNEELCIDLKSLPVIVGQNGYSTGRSKEFYNIFNEPLALEKRAIAQIEGWFEPPTLPDDFKELEDRFQKIYDEALKRGSVTVNRCRVIVAGQDGAGKSCLVDSLLNRPFEQDKASTDGAAVTMTHTAATVGWKATDNKEHLDSYVAESVYLLEEQKSDQFLTDTVNLSIQLDEPDKGKSERPDDISTSVDSIEPFHQVEIRQEDDGWKDIGMKTKTLTQNQHHLLKNFHANKPSEKDLSKHILGVRDIWDLGGQEVYLATHSALMPDSETFGLSMYMIVMDISKSLSEEAKSSHRSLDGQSKDQTDELGWIRTNGDFPLYWFGSITAAHEERPRGDHWRDKDENVAYPPVFAIGSHRDVLGTNKARFPDSEKWLREQSKLFEQLLNDSNFAKHIVVAENGASEKFREIAHFVDRIFLINNSASGSKSPCQSVNEIRERVDRMTKTYWKKMEKRQPLYWVYLELRLFGWCKERNTVVAKFNKIAELARDDCNISIREVPVALKYLSNVGAILYYPEVDGLKDVVFTRPMWVIKALSAFVSAAGPRALNEPEWKTLKKEGIMSNDLMEYRLSQIRMEDSSDLATALKEATPEQTKEENERIVRLLQLLDVITPVKGSHETKFYVPSMLKTKFIHLPTYLEDLLQCNSKPLCCRPPGPLIVIPEKLKFVPECLFFRLITRFLKVYSKRPQLSRHQCIFQVDDEPSDVRVEVELLYHNRGEYLALTIHFVEDKDPGEISELFLASIKDELCEQMDKVCQPGMRGFKYSICCQTKKVVRTDNKFLIDFESLPVIDDCDSPPPRKKPKFYNPHGKRLAKVEEDNFQIDCWFGHPLIGDRSSQSTSALPQVVNEPLIHAVATLVKANWDELAVFLERSQGDRLQYKENSQSYFVRAVEAIEDWKKCSKEAKVTALLQACKKCGISKNIIEEAYKEALKQSQ